MYNMNYWELVMPANIFLLPFNKYRKIYSHLYIFGNLIRFHEANAPLNNNNNLLSKLHLPTEPDYLNPPQSNAMTTS